MLVFDLVRNLFASIAWKSLVVAVTLKLQSLLLAFALSLGLVMKAKSCPSLEFGLIIGLELQGTWDA